MQIFKNKKKRADAEISINEAEEALMIAKNSLRSERNRARIAITIAERLKESREANHYAERIAAAYSEERKQ